MNETVMLLVKLSLKEARSASWPRRNDPPAEPATPGGRSLEIDDQLVDPVPEVLP